MVLGMTRDELFQEFSRFVSSRGEAAQRAAAASADGDDEPASELGDEPQGAAVVERPQPAKVHAKAKTKKRR